MRLWFQQLDLLLRGEKTRPTALTDEGLDVPVRGLAVVVIVLCMSYGLCMGSFSLLQEVPPEIANVSPRYMQLVATTIKVPILFWLTLLITLPSLYVLNALVGSQLSATNLLRLLVASLAVNAAVLASMGPIVLFFSLSTNSYPFILLLNVTAFTVAGVLGLSFLLQTLHRLTSIQHAIDTPLVSRAEADARESDVELTVGEESENSERDDNRDERDSSARRVEELHALQMPEGQMLARHTRLVFRCWVLLFALVGAQTGWVLRPFVGSPNLAFAWFRERESNFFAAIFRAFIDLLSGG